MSEVLPGIPALLCGRIMEEREKSFRSEELQSILLFKSGPREQLALSLPMVRRIEPIMVKDIELIGNKEYITVDGVSTQHHSSCIGY